MALDEHGGWSEAAESGWRAVENAAQAVIYRESGEYPLLIPSEMNLSEHPCIRKPALERGGVYFEIRESLKRFERHLRDDAHLGGVYSVRIPARLREVCDYILLCAGVCGVEVWTTGPIKGHPLNAGGYADEARGRLAWQESLEQARKGGVA